MFSRRRGALQVAHLPCSIKSLWMALHRQFNPDRFKPEPPEGMDAIDEALGGL